MLSSFDVVARRSPLQAGMRNMKSVLIVLLMALGLAACAETQMDVGAGIRASDLSIGIELSSYPDLVPVPGYPVYYYPGGDFNYFYYDGLYWVLSGDNWYASGWYNGPWNWMDPYYVPAFVLRIPVRYYRRPPVYFRGWPADSPPRWDEHWGSDWNTRRRGWDQWDRRSVPPPAPLPTYQGKYSGDRYPRAPEQRNSIRTTEDHYQPREPVSRQYWQLQQTQRPRAQQPPLMQRPPIQPRPPQVQPAPAQQPPQIYVPPVQQPPQLQPAPTPQPPQLQPVPAQQPPRMQRPPPQQQPPQIHMPPAQQPPRMQRPPDQQPRQMQHPPAQQTPHKDAAPSERGRDNKDRDHDQDRR
jgi:hypothetical protein